MPAIGEEILDVSSEYNFLDTCVAYNVDVDQLDNILNVDNDEN